jgi:hypothetical protein
MVPEILLSCFVAALLMRCVNVTRIFKIVTRINENSTIVLIVSLVNFLKNARFLIPIIFLISGCAAVAPQSLTSGETVGASGEDGPTTSGADMVLSRIQLLVKHGHLEDSAYVSKVLDIRLAGGELESGHGDMIYTCALQTYANMRIWKGRRYRYEDGPSYLAPQPFPATSKCFNPYVIDEADANRVAASLRIDLNIKDVCITLADVKKHFKTAYYSKSGGGFSVRYHIGDVSNHVAMRIESTHAGKICANIIVLDQNDFSPELF